MKEKGWVRNAPIFLCIVMALGLLIAGWMSVQQERTINKLKMDIEFKNSQIEVYQEAFR